MENSDPFNYPTVDIPNHHPTNVDGITGPNLRYLIINLKYYVLAGALSVWMTANVFFWMEPLLASLIADDSEIPGLTTSDTSWLVAIIEVGELFSTIPAGMASDRWGRKLVILSTGPMCVVGWVLVLTTRSLEVLYFVRILHGVAVAVVFVVVPIYMAEIADPSIRGELSAHFMTFWYLGTLFNYCVGPYLSYQNYTYACCAVPVLFTLTFSFVPETPFYYMMKDKPEKARKALQWLRGSDDVDTEFKSISQTVAAEMKNKASWGDLVKTRKDVRALFIVNLVAMMKYLNGMTAVTSYATETFRQGTTIDPHYLTIGLGCVLCTTTFLAAFVTDSVGRRPLLLISIAGGVIFNVFIAIYYYVAQYTEIQITDYYWVMFIAVVGFCIAANVGTGPLLQTMQAEYFPSNTRGIAGGIIELTASAAGFVSIKTYQMVTDAIGIYMNYVIFALTGVVGFVILWFLVKETAGLSLGEIHQGTEMKEKGKEDRSIKA